MLVGIINNGVGNVGSLQRAIAFHGVDARLIEHIDDLRKVDVIALAGVGNFNTAVGKLRSSGFWEELTKWATVDKLPILGICLGMQLFADVSYEGGKNRGFGWIPGDVLKLEGTGLRLPHIGWNFVFPTDNDVFKGIRYGSFYFMHSYHFVPRDDEVVLARTRYGAVNFTAAIRKDNIMGFQFHPEKSQGDGYRVVKNALEELARYQRE